MKNFTLEDFINLAKEAGINSIDYAADFNEFKSIFVMPEIYSTSELKSLISQWYFFH